MAEEENTPPQVLNEVVESEISGTIIGQVKWFNDKLGFGFITINDGPEKGKDIFVHHSGIKPANSNYKTLRKGEYVNFNVVKGLNGLQAVDITGINGGPLMCDIVMGSRKEMYAMHPQMQAPVHQFQQPPPPPPPRKVDEWQTIPKKQFSPRPTGAKPVKNYNKYNKATRNQPPGAPGPSVPSV
jgi:CspA family cold shock protein